MDTVETRIKRRLAVLGKGRGFTFHNARGDAYFRNMMRALRLQRWPKTDWDGETYARHAILFREIGMPAMEPESWKFVQGKQAHTGAMAPLLFQRESDAQDFLDEKEMCSHNIEAIVVNADIRWRATPATSRDHGSYGVAWRWKHAESDVPCKQELYLLLQHGNNEFSPLQVATRAEAEKFISNPNSQAEYMAVETDVVWKPAETFFYSHLSYFLVSESCLRYILGLDWANAVKAQQETATQFPGQVMTLIDHEEGFTLVEVRK